MVLRRGIAVLCLAAVAAMSEVSFVEASSQLQETSASDHHHHHHRHHRSVDHVKENKDNEDVVKTYEHGNVHISSKKHAEKDAKDSHHKSTKTHKKKQAEEKKSKKEAKKDHHHHKTAHHKKDVQESVTDDGEIVRQYPHGNVRIVKKVSPTLIEHHNKSKKDKKNKKDKKEKASKKNKKAHEAVDSNPSDEIVDFEGDIPDGGELEIETYGDGEVEVNVDGAPLGINVHDGVVDITYKGKKSTYKGDVVADIELDDSETSLEGSSSDELEEEWAEFDSDESAASGWVEFDDSGSDDSFEVGSEAASGSGSDVGFIEVAEEELNEAVEKISELATEFAAEGNSLINHYGPVVVICGIFGALAAIIGVAAVAVNRARSHMNEDDNVASVLSDASDVDVEAGVSSEEMNDAAAADSDSLDDSESDEDEDEEGSFTNDGHVSV